MSDKDTIVSNERVEQSLSQLMQESCGIQETLELKARWDETGFLSPEHISQQDPAIRPYLACISKLLQQMQQLARDRDEKDARELTTTAKPDYSEEEAMSISEIEVAMERWSYLVPPKNTDHTRQVNEIMKEAFPFVNREGSREKIDRLVRLVRSPGFEWGFSNYVHMVYQSSLHLGTATETAKKYGGMFAAMADNRNGNADLFWQFFDRGYFDST